MIPRKLRLKNFLSYGDDPQSLDFDQFHIAAITGKNGAGKSTLVEAILFCLWGNGRGNNAELIRKGATEARVEMEFELKGNLYRVARSLSRGRNQLTHKLSLGIYDASEKEYRNIGGGGVQETQAKIDRLIGISRETFAHSAFFGQGKADDLIRAAPAERRKILAEILGSNRYDALSKKAEEKAEDCKKEIAASKTRIQILEQDVSNLLELRADLERKKAERQRCEALANECKAKLENLNQTLLELAQKAVALNALDKQIASLEADHKRETDAVQRKEAEIRDIDSRLSKRPELERKQQEAQTLKEEIRALDEKQRQAQELKDQIARHENDYNQQKARLEAERNSKTERIESLSKLISERDARLKQKKHLLDKHQSLQARLAELAKEVARLPKVESSLNDARQNEANLRAEISATQSQMETIKEKGIKAKDLGDVCPLCQSTLSNEHKERVLEHYRNEYRALQKQAEDRATLLAIEEDKVRRLQNDLDALRKKETEKHTVDLDLTLVINDLKTLEGFEMERQRFVAERTTHEENLKGIEERLLALAPLRDEIQSLKARLDEIGYDSTLHQGKKKALEGYEGIAETLARLENDERRKEQLRGEIAEHQARRQSLSQSIAQNRQQADLLRQDLERKPDLEREQRELSRQNEDLDKQLQDIRVRIQSLECDIQSKEQKQAKIEALRQKIAPIEEKQKLYEILKKAFGRDGIQHLLLAEAVPVIERHANELLSRLTNNLFSLSIKTENRNDRPTLEIFISDAMGETRNYETFSGGERFRIDFALRLALSEYLSQMSGTPVKLLVIDEGFGSQDEEGIDIMTEVIKQVGDRFEKILVISHLEKMKDAFSPRISVVKDLRKGSRFEVID